MLDIMELVMKKLIKQNFLQDFLNNLEILKKKNLII